LDTVHQDDPRRGEKNVKTGEQLLLAQRNQRRPILMNVESARLTQDLVEFKFPNEAQHALFGDFVIISPRRERLPQRARRQVRLLGEKENAVATGPEDASLARAPKTRRRPEESDSWVGARPGGDRC
jgi:hypothetical protein